MILLHARNLETHSKLITQHHVSLSAPTKLTHLTIWSCTGADVRADPVLKVAWRPGGSLLCTGKIFVAVLHPATIFNTPGAEAYR